MFFESQCQYLAKRKRSERDCFPSLTPPRAFVSLSIDTVIQRTLHNKLRPPPPLLLLPDLPRPADQLGLALRVRVLDDDDLRRRVDVDDLAARFGLARAPDGRRALG